MALHQGLRPSLEPLTKQSTNDVHPGLWLDRFLSHTTFAKGAEPAGYDPEAAKRARDLLVSRVDHKGLPMGYRAAWDRWRGGLLDDGLRACVCEVESDGRVVIGIGQKNPAEFGITLHRTWGVPILPGSSLKGIASLGADRYLDGDDWRRRPEAAQARPEGPTAYDALFGDVEEQGAVIFHDAWFVPAPDNKNGLYRDVLTVHHPGYYQQAQEPSDTESPIPVPFMSAKGKFLIALELHPSLDPATHGHWLEAAWEALRLGLSRHGVGSKTNAGYGRFALPAFSQTSTGQALTTLVAEREAADRAANRVAQRAPLSVADRVVHVVADEGIDALIKWVRGEGAPAIDGLPFDAPHVEEAAVAAFRGQLAKGVSAGLSGSTKAAWDAGVSRAAGSPSAPVVSPPKPGSARKSLNDDELQARLARFTKKEDWNGFATLIAKEGVDADTLRRAITLLTSQKRVKPGHLKALNEELARAES